MAFTLQAIVGSTTVNLTNGSPFKLLSATGMGGAPVRRVSARGPAQQGDTDLGYRLQAREIELEIGFAATSDSVLDGYRDTLASIFKPTASTPVQLRVTRDDAEVRALDCYTVGVLRIDLVPDHRPGHYHVATVRLRAPEPSYYDIAPGTITVTGSSSFESNWYLAGGAIGTARVLMHGSAPAQGEAWSYNGTIVHTASSFTLAIRNAGTPTPGSSSYMFLVGTTTGYSNYQPALLHLATGEYVMGTSNYDVSRPGISLGTTAVSPGTHNYYLHTNATGFQVAPTDPIEYMRWVGPHGTIASQSPLDVLHITGTPRTWRSTAWTPSIVRYALYSPTLTPAQQSALDAFMGFGVDSSTVGTISQSLTVPYEGNSPEYPVISLTGPISSPQIVNTATGKILSFGTHSIGAGTTYVIDTRYGYKTVTSGTVSKRSELTDDSDLGEWALVPAPLAPGGTNIISVYGTAISGNTEVEIVYYNRYTGF